MASNKKGKIPKINTKELKRKSLKSLEKVVHSFSTDKII